MLGRLRLTVGVWRARFLSGIEAVAQRYFLLGFKPTERARVLFIFF
jgi:hypothetical protein